MNLRTATEHDLASVAELALRIQRMHVQALPEVYRDIPVETIRDFLSPSLRSEGHVLLVAESGSSVVGFVVAIVREPPASPIFRPERSLYLLGIAVSPDCRRSGVGRALVKRVFEVARERGCARVDLEVGVFNATARSFFRSQGFDPALERMSATTRT